MTAAAVVLIAASVVALVRVGDAVLGDSSSAPVGQQLDTGTAKNVILLIGDGMGDSEITIARYYEYGAAGVLPGIDALPVTGQYTTSSVYGSGELRGLPDYAPDSSATATAWATGTKTYDGAVSVDIDRVPHATLLEIARANGLRTGNVSTAAIQDATPAAQVAHVSSRGCLGPVATTATCAAEAVENGGLGSITEQLLDARPDVTLGGGASTFAEVAQGGAWQGATLLDQARARGYQVVRTAAELAATTSADQSRPVLGLFAENNFPTRWSPTVATVGGAGGVAERCTVNPDALGAGLGLADLTSTAISLLDSEASTGFFLQVEGASIDKQDHAANACGQIGETIDLDEAVQVALEFARKDGNTLVVVTADHAHSSQIVDGATPGLGTVLTTNEGSPLRISYGTAGAGGSQQHTGSQLRIAAFGPGSGKVLGLTDQTDLFTTVSTTLQLTLDAATLSTDLRVEGFSSPVAPGGPVTVTATGFAGDRQVTAALQSGVIGTADVIDGRAAFSFAAPMTSGHPGVTFTGVQTGSQVSKDLDVR